MGKRNRVTTRDIAKEAGVSQSTVSQILSGNPSVSFSEETRAHVTAVAEKMGYKAPEKKTGKKNTLLRDTILVLCPILSNPYYTAAIHSITEHARTYGYHVHTITTLRNAENEDLFIEKCRTMIPAGIICLYPLSSVARLNKLSQEFPVVTVGARQKNVRHDSLELDNVHMGYVMGNYLLSLGHRDIAYLSGPIRASDISRSDRVEGMRKAFEEQGTDPGRIRLFKPEPAVYKDYRPDEAEYKNGYDMTMDILKNDPGFTVFAGHNDMTALGIMDAVLAGGYKIPSDYSVCGFDNTVLSGMGHISLTTIEHATVQKGRQAVDIIHRRNQAKGTGKGPSYIMTMEYEPELIIRRSTGPVRKGI